MKRTLAIMVSALLLGGCAKNGQGSYGSNDSGSGSGKGSAPAHDLSRSTDSRIGPNATPTTADSAYDPAIASSITPSVPAPNQASTNPPSAAEPNSVRKQVNADQQAERSK